MRDRARPRRRRGLLMAVGAVAGVAVVWFATAVTLFIAPRQQPLHPADAVVVLAPSSTRLAPALDAYDAGTAQRLWVSYFAHDDIDPSGARMVDKVCAAPSRDTVCFTPDTDDTLGEARRVAELVEQSGAQSVIVTTHVSHSARARFIFERCLPEGTDVQLLLVDEPGGMRHALGRMIYETGAFVKALLQVGTCG